MTKLIYEKGKPMREEGFMPAMKEKAREAINIVIGLPGRAMGAAEERLKGPAEYRKKRNEGMIRGNWGNEENYEKTLTPKAKQKDAIRKVTGGRH